MRWSYKTVHFGLKKDGLLGNSFLDEAEIEISLNNFGKSGWELVSFMEVNDGMIAVFKQPLGQGLPVLQADEDQYEKETDLGQKEQKKMEVISPPKQPPVSAVQSSENINTESAECGVGAIRIDL